MESIKNKILEYKNNRILLIYIRGFTLIEMLIATSLFTFVTFIAITTLFMMQTTNEKVKITRNIYDNMFLVVDDISRETKYGSYFENTNYALPSAGNCNVTLDCMTFEYLDNENLVSQRHGYYLDQAQGKIYKYTQNGAGYDVQPITTDDISVDMLKFKIQGINTYTDPASPDTRHPSVKLILKGHSLSTPEVEFFIESYLTERSSAN